MLTLAHHSLSIARLQVTAVEGLLDDASGHSITALEDALGVTDVEKALGLE